MLPSIHPELGMQQDIFLKSFWVIQVQSQVWKLLSQGPDVWVRSHGSLGWYRNSTMATDCIPHPVNCLVTLDGWVTVGTKWGVRVAYSGLVSLGKGLSKHLSHWPGGTNGAIVASKIWALTLLLSSHGLMGPDFLNRVMWGSVREYMPGITTLSPAGPDDKW